MKIRKVWVYVIALSPFAFFYEQIKNLIGNDFVFVLIGVVVALSARYIAEKVGAEKNEVRHD
jgi:hypothetical protein